jgi:hypothetical protein
MARKAGMLGPSTRTVCGEVQHFAAPMLPARPRRRRSALRAVEARLTAGGRPVLRALDNGGRQQLIAEAGAAA